LGRSLSRWSNRRRMNNWRRSWRWKTRLIPTRHSRWTTRTTHRRRMKWGSWISSSLSQCRVCRVFLLQDALYSATWFAGSISWFSALCFLPLRTILRRLVNAI
jgi:hypothetical protein